MKIFSWDRFAAVVFLAFLVGYVVLAWLASQGIYHAAFDSIHGYRIFNIDDAYRRYLASTSTSSSGIWVWAYYLPFNFAFDGVLSRLTDHSNFLMRVPHVLANLGGLWLVYRAGRYLDIHPGWSLLACCTLLWMPLYALVSMSFYAESLLAALMGVVIYALASQRERLLAVTASAMPLIRPEGAFYLGFVTVHHLWKRRFKQVLVMIGPACLYFIAILVVFHFSWSDYWLDRRAFGSLYKAVGASNDVTDAMWLPYFTVNPLWWLLGLAGGLLPSMQRLRPLLFGALFLMVYWFLQMQGGNANGEARYYLSLLPLFALYQAALLQWLVCWVRHGWKRLAAAILTLTMLFIGVENILQLDPIRNTYFEGNRYPIGQTETRYQQFNVLSPSYPRSLKQVYAFTCAYAKYDSAVNKVIVNAFQWFNKSEVCDLPDRVRVELGFMRPEVAFRYTQGYFLTMFPQLPHYAFYQFLPAPNKKVFNGNQYALYVTMQGNVFPGEAIAPLFTNRVFSVFKVRYRQYLHTPFFP